MKLLLKLLGIFVLVLLFGSLPLNIIAKFFEWLSIGFNAVGDAIDFFGWGGII